MSEPEVITSPTHMYGSVGIKLNLPTHVPNSDGQATHPSVVFNPDGWNGFNYWMAMTPYPGANDSHEDPNILVSNDGINWTNPPGVVNPLDNAVGSPGAYNSDTEIVWGPNGYLYVFWRNFDPAATGAEEKIYYRRSLNGRVWESKVLVYQSDQSQRRLLSPTFEFETDGLWSMWANDMSVSPFKLVRLRSRTNNPSWSSGWGAPVDLRYTGASYLSDKQPWHLYVTKAYGKYHALVNDITASGGRSRGSLIYMTSSDGITWTSALNSAIPISQTGEHDVLYRGCMIPSVERGILGFRVWYGAFRYTNPQVWNIYRTFISDGPHSVRQTFTIPSLPASGGYAYRNINFEAIGGREFKYTPDISINSSSAAVGVALTNVSTTGFTIHIDNWSPKAASNVIVRWHASEPMS